MPLIISNSGTDSRTASLSSDHSRTVVHDFFNVYKICSVIDRPKKTTQRLKPVANEKQIFHYARGQFAGYWARKNDKI